MADKLGSTFLENESIVRYHKTTAEVDINGTFTEMEVLTADADFFTMFSFPLLSGNADEVLQRDDHIVITQKMARRLFGQDIVMGKLITIKFFDEERLFKVTGIAENIPSNSSIQFDFVIPFENAYLNFPPGPRNRYIDNWHINIAETYIMLTPGATTSDFNKRAPRFLLTHYGLRSMYYQQRRMRLQPLSEIYFDEEITSRYTLQRNIPFLFSAMQHPNNFSG